MEKVLLIDVNAITYRFYYKLMNMRNMDGRPTGASFGLVNTLIKLLDKFKPDYVAACFDVKRESLKRREILAKYKSGRLAAPEDLNLQAIDIKKILENFGIKSISVPGFEADDVIGTLSDKFSENNTEVYIFTGDKDLLQLVKENVKVVLFGKGDEDFDIISDVNKVLEVIGVYPNQIPDLFALQGDATDGIPGVRGIGPKSAQKLIQQFDTLEKIYENLEDAPAKMKEVLEENKEIAFISKTLATIHKSAFVVDFKEFRKKDINKVELLELLKILGFRSVIKKLNLESENYIDLDFLVIERSELYDHVKNKETLSLFKSEHGVAICSDNLNLYIKSSFEELDIKNPLILYNSKEFIKIKNINVDFDVMLAAHLLSPEEHISFDRLSSDYLNIVFKEDNEIELVKKAYTLFKLKNLLIEKLNSEQLLDVLKKEELPLVPVLANMETNGIKIDVSYLKEYEVELDKKIFECEQEIYRISNEKFNIASNKQLSEVLYNKMNIKPLKKNKSSYSTDNEVLELLQEQEIEIATHLLEYRKLVKLQNTYVRALPKIVDKNDRIHTTFNQDGTSTGRLSSSKPNLQNIPSRTYEGRKIRKSFISEKDHSFIIADYSQVELRILASISNDPELISAFQEDLDLHMQTAKILFMKEAKDITKIERDKAKVINFSVIYGKSSYGLAKELKITPKEASSYIERYFENYKDISNFINLIILNTKEDGFIKTLFGRKRYISGINSKNLALRKSAERMAVNAVIQGTQAEIIKRSMIEIYNKIKKSEDIKMILQIHDELIFEVKDDKKEFYTIIIKDIMEKCTKIPNVSLKVNIGTSKNWEEAK